MDIQGAELVRNGAADEKRPIFVQCLAQALDFAQQIHIYGERYEFLILRALVSHLPC